MAMVPTGMRDAIKTAMIAQGFDPDNSETDGEALKFLTALGEGIVLYIQSNAQANVTSGSSSGTWPII